MTASASAITTSVGRLRRSSCFGHAFTVPRDHDLPRAALDGARTRSPAMHLDGRQRGGDGRCRGIGAALARRFHAAGAHVVVADVLGAVAGRRVARARRSPFTADVSTEDGNVGADRCAPSPRSDPIDLFFANAGMAIGTDLSDAGAGMGAGDARQRRRPPLGGEAPAATAGSRPGSGYFCSTASAAGLLAQIGSLGYTVTKRAAVAFAEWLSITYGDQRGPGQLPVPAGGQHRHAQRRRSAAARRGASAGVVLEPDEVADGRRRGDRRRALPVLPHPEVPST